MQFNIPTVLTQAVQSTDYKAIWVNGDPRRAKASQSVGYFTPTYFGINNTDTSARIVKVWTDETWDGTEYPAASGVEVLIPAGGIFYAYIGQLTWTGTDKFVLLGSKSKPLSR